MKLEVCSVPGFEEVVVCRDEQSGLHAIAAIHDTSLGPAAGGCRMHPYAREEDALHDVLRLARGMSYKSALADLALGGGKSVIIGDPGRDKSPELLRAFGRFINRFEGRYVAAEDVGICVADVEVMARETAHVAGRTKGSSSGGDPSPLTARGVLTGMEAALAYRAGSGRGASLAGARIALQGLGQVGFALLELLLFAGADVVVADMVPARTQRARALGARVSTPEDILFEPCDILAPCALGGVFDETSIPRVRAGIVAGAANNQLAQLEHGDLLQAAGILCAPDYVINAGGIINVANELRGHYDRAWTDARIAGIGPRLQAIFRESSETGASPQRVADAMARRVLRKARATRGVNQDAASC